MFESFLRPGKSAADRARVIATSKGPLEMAGIDFLRADDGTRAATIETMLDIQNASMRSATHERDLALEEATRIYTERVVGRSTDWLYNKVFVFRSEGKPVGIVQGRARLVTFRGQPTEVCQMTVFIVPEWRNQRLIAKAFLPMAMEYASRHLLSGRKRYFAGIAMAPRTYRFVYDRVRALYPGPTEEVPASMRDLHAHFFADLVNADGLVVEPRATIVDPAMKAGLATSDHPAVRFYMRKNPRFAEGFGLPFLVRLEPRDYLYSLARSVSAEVERRLRR